MPIKLFSLNFLNKKNKVNLNSNKSDKKEENEQTDEIIQMKQIEPSDQTSKSEQISQEQSYQTNFDINEIREDFLEFNSNFPEEFYRIISEEPIMIKQMSSNIEKLMKNVLNLLEKLYRKNEKANVPLSVLIILDPYLQESLEYDEFLELHPTANFMTVGPFMKIFDNQWNTKINFRNHLKNRVKNIKCFLGLDYFQRKILCEILKHVISLHQKYKEQNLFIERKESIELIMGDIEQENKESSRKSDNLNEESDEHKLNDEEANYDLNEHNINENEIVEMTSNEEKLNV